MKMSLAFWLACTSPLFGASYYEPLPEIRSGAMEEHTRRQKREARELDEKFTEAARIVTRHKEASVSMLQRRR